MSAEQSVAANTLNTLDRDRYLASLFLPSEKRADVQAVWAFAAELSAIRERVSEPMPGEIRLQWWSDALKGEGHGDVMRNPLAASLIEAIARYNLQTGPMQRLIAARRFDLYQDPMPDMETFEGYAGETNSILFQYAAIILNDGQNVEPSDAAGHLGVAHALVGHLKAFGFNASQMRIFLPLAFLQSFGVSEGQIFTGARSEGLVAARAALLEAVRDHLRKADAAISKLPAVTLPAMALRAVVEQDVASLASVLDRPYAPPPVTPDWRKLWGMFRWGMKRH